MQLYEMNLIDTTKQLLMYRISFTSYVILVDTTDDTNEHLPLFRSLRGYSEESFRR